MLMPVVADVTVPPLLLLLAALIIDAAVGGRPGPLAVLPHPVRLIGGLVDRLDAALNREGDGDGRRRALGVLAVVVVCGMCGGIGWIVWALAQRFPLLVVVELAFMASLLAQRSLFIHVRAVAQALRAGGLAAGQTAVGQIVGRDVASLDEAGVARAAIESTAENFCDGVVAPVFWAALFGLPGLLVYKAANTCDSMIGHKSKRYRAFGWAAARLDDGLNLIPARLSGLLIVAAAALLPTGRTFVFPSSSRLSRGSTTTGEDGVDGRDKRGHDDATASAGPSDAHRAWTTMLRDARHHRSPNAGWPEAAAAGALDVRLGGPRRYGDEAVDAPWLGADDRAEATADDIDRMLRLYVLACALTAGVVAALAGLDLAP